MKIIQGGAMHRERIQGGEMHIGVSVLISTC